VPDLDALRSVVAFCRDHGTLLVSDVGYSELGLQAERQPSSVLQLPGARAIGVEVLDLERTVGLRPWGVGLCVGAAEILAAALRRRLDGDAPVPVPSQLAAARALTGDDTHLQDRRRRVQRRRDRLVEGLRGLGWEVPAPPAGPHLWAPVPSAWSGDDFAFARALFERAGILVVPGSAFGPGGRGRVRLTLALDEAGMDACLGVLAESRVLAGFQAEGT
jgi:aspartate/methionine/tyrosine aminotransferase